jgi:chaperonin GroES
VSAGRADEPNQTRTQNLVSGKDVSTLFTVKVGNKVLISKYGGTEVKLNGEDVLIINETDILGIIA